MIKGAVNLINKGKIFDKMIILFLFVFFINISCVSATNFTVDEIGNASTSVQTYVEANHKLPNNVTISGTTVTMPQFLKLETTATYNIKNNITTDITLENYNTAPNPSETATNGQLTQSNYITLANNVKSFMNENGRAPNFQTTSLGNIRYESLVYTFSQVMNSYRVGKVLPDFIIIRPWTFVTNNTTKFITMNQINVAADTVQSYIETNHQLPNHVTISKYTVSMPSLLRLEAQYIKNGNGKLYQSIPLGRYGTAPNPYESITGGNLEKSDYLNSTTDIISFMNDNGRAPNGITTIRGTIRYESLVFTYAEIINSASEKLILPNYIRLTPWTTVSNTNTVFINMDQINTAASTVKLHIETNHTLPSYVNISGRQISMPNFLKLEILSIQNIYEGLHQSIILQNYNTAPNPSESMTGRKLNYLNYMNAAENIRSFMHDNGRAPNFSTTEAGNIRYESIIYTYAQLLNYYNVNNALPRHITVTPWSVVSNPNTVTFNPGQIIKGAETIVSYVEANHNLPTSVNIAGTSVSMSKFLKLSLTTLQNINGNLYGQIVLENFNEPGSTSESITGGSLNKTEYLELAMDVENFIIANGRGPAYQTSNLGNIRYQSLVYMFSQVLSSYKSNNYTLPELITVRPWSVISNTSTKFFTIDQIETAATTVKNYVETNHALPNSVNINGTSVNMSQFLKLITTAVANINGKLNSTVVLQNYNAAPNPSETIIGGIISSKDYLSLANNIISFMDTNGRAPNFQTVTMGNIRFNSLVFMFSQILAYEKTEEILPQSITVDKWSVVSNVNNKFFTLDQIETAAATVQSYVETNHNLPTTISIGTTTVTRAQFLQLLTAAVQNANGNLLTSFIKATYDEPPTPSENITDPTFSNADYIKLAKDVNEFMYANGRGPNYKATTHGNIQYQTLVYMFSQLVNSYNLTDAVPLSITINPWATLSNSNTVFFTLDEIKNASKSVKNYVDTYSQLPTSVTISGRQVSMSQFLKLTAQSVINIENYLNTAIILGSVSAPSSPTENIISGTIYSDEFTDIAENVISYIDSHGTAPKNVSDTSLGDTMRYESLIYMFSKILISYKPTEHAPHIVSVIPWLALSGITGNLIFEDNICTGSDTLENTTGVSGTGATVSSSTDWAWQGIRSFKVQTNGSTVGESIDICKIGTASLPYAVLVQSGQTYTVSAYVKGSGTVRIELVGRNSTGTATESYSSPSMVLSNIPQKLSITHLLSDPSTIYATAKILTSNTVQTITFYVDSISLTRYDEEIHNGTFNFRTQKIFDSIQTAIDDPTTIDGDTIWLGNLNYTENININKKITIRPISGVNVVIQPLNPTLPIFTINTSGSSTTIQDLVIDGSTGNAGIYINNSATNEILGNNIINNLNGIYLYNSTENVVSGNIILNNSLNGVLISAGSDNEVSSNKITYNSVAGINVQNSDKCRIYSNLIHNNYDGIHLNNSTAEIHLNSIVENSRYGLYKVGNGTANATNNWWGSNNPIVSLTSPSDIGIAGGSVTYDPWLVLSINSSTDRSNRSGTHYNYIITADLTHNNHGNDTSSDGNIPDNIPVNFSSTLGTINSSGSTKKGKAELKLTSSSAGTANVSVTLDNQTVSKTVNVTSVNVLGVYNTRTQESFATIQEAVDDPDTKDGDIITLAEGIYTENVAINKKLSIQPVTGANVTVEADNSDKSVFVMNNEGSGTTIKNLNIESSADSYGISLSHSYNVNIINNIITNSSKGIYLYKSGNNIITGNTVKNSRYGIFLYNSNCNSILGGNIKINENGLYLFNSDNNQINGTIITENYYGTYLFYSNNNDIIGNVISDNWVGTYLYDTNSNSITGNSLSDNGVGITHYNSIGIILSGNNFTDNLLADSSTIDSGEMVLATTIYSCGAAALATILKSFGIYATENELATLAGTDETGASFYGLKTAAQSMGVSAIGARLTVDQLKTNYLVVLDIDGKKHFEIIKNITTTTVYLFDPNLGNIEMPLDKFNEMYTGVALVLNDTLPPGTVLLTDDEMRDIKALGYWTKDAHYFTIPGFYYPTIEWRSFSYPVPVLKWKWVPPYKLFGIIPIPGHTEPYITLEWRTGSYPVVVWRYQPPQRFVYYTPRWVKEEGEVWNDNVYIKVFKGAIAISTGTTMIRGGIGLIGITEGWGTPAGIILIGMGAGVTWYGVEQVIDGLDDPWSVKPNRFLYD